MDHFFRHWRESAHGSTRSSARSTEFGLRVGSGLPCKPKLFGSVSLPGLTWPAA